MSSFAVPIMDEHWPQALFLKDSSFSPMVRCFQGQTLNQVYILVSSAHKTTCSDMIYTLLKAMLTPK